MDKSLVLEILRHGNQLSMSISGRDELASTLRHYSQCEVSFIEIYRLTEEINSLLNKTQGVVRGDFDLAGHFKKNGQLLWDQLLTRSVKQVLKTTPIKGLVLSIDEELINIPWELLFDGNDFLCLKFNLGRLLKTKNQLGFPAFRGRTADILKMLVLANPNNDLKSAYQEGIYIKDQFGCMGDKINIDLKSTYVDRLYVKKNLRDYDIVHFAGHCDYDKGNIKNSGWVLSDGKFSASDIVNLGESSPLPLLIFSNACCSARNTENLKEEDYQWNTYSLAAAFLFSGVKLYVGTIWEVEDHVSLIYAKEFYSRLISRKNIGECVRLARLKIIEEYGFNAFSWASYILYGDPGFLLFDSISKPQASNWKSKRNNSNKKKILQRLFLFLPVMFLSLWLYKWLPSFNPSTYFLFHQADKLFLNGKNQEVVLLCDKIIEREPSFLMVYPLLGDTYLRFGKRDAALKYYFDYAFYSEKKNDKKNLISAYTGIGWIYHQQGQYTKAFDFYSQALNLSLESKDKLNEAVVLRKMAILHIDREEYDKALELLTKSSEINREKKHIYQHRYNLACDYFDIGLLFTDKDDLTAAKGFYKKSLKLFSQLKLKHELSDYYFNLGEISRFEKRYQQALGLYYKGLSIDENLGDIINLASDYEMIGELYLEMGNFNNSSECFDKAVSILIGINAPLELASVYHNLGLLNETKGDLIKKEEFFRMAEEIYKKTDAPLNQKIN